MTIVEYRKLKNLTQPRLAEELYDIVPGIDAPLISKMERGMCEPSKELQAYLDAQEEIIGQDVIELTPDESDIYLALLTHDYYNRLSRHELMVLTGKSDRFNRKTIENLRNKGIRVCSDSFDQGYYLAGTQSEYMRFRGALIARLKSLAKTIKAMDEHVSGQISL